MTALELIIQERLRQQTEEGYTPAHDDEHENGELAFLAAAYALSSRPDIGPDPALSYLRGILEEWDWDFNPKDPISDLVRAGACTLAELERRLREEGK